MYIPNKSRYQEMIFNRVGNSGLKLPAISLGLWHNFGEIDDFKNASNVIKHAFDAGITHFDLANNYGPPAGSAETTFGKILAKDLKCYRDELVISTKAGYLMWEGPYGEWGSKKHLISSLDQSLQRMGLEYVDIFYSHRPDPGTPLEETMHALDTAVKSGKAMYAGVSSYNADQTAKAKQIANEMGFPLIIHQPKYSILDRWIENGLIKTLEDIGMGSIVFSPLAQGLLSDRYLNGIDKDSRAAKPTGYLKKETISEELIAKITELNAIALNRGQSLAQMAISWVLRVGVVNSALIGVSKLEQLQQNIASLDLLTFSQDEYAAIDKILGV